MAGKKCVLIVDNEQEFCQAVKTYLELTEEFEVLTAFNGPDGIKIAQEKKPDLILLDIVMPGMDGGAVATQLENKSNTQHIPIIFLTAAVGDEETTSGGLLEISGRKFLAKPVSTQKLIDVIKGILTKNIS